MIRNKVVVANRATLKVPAHLSVGEYFLEKISQICDREGDAVALVNGNTGEQVTYNQLLQATVNTAVGLKQLGVERGDVLAFYSESKNELVSGYMGALCCGATITVYNTLYNKDELQHVLDISKPNIVICSPTTLAAHLDVLKSTESVKHIIQINGEPIEGVISLSEVLGNADPRTYEPESVSGASDTALISYSSGTTGLPKGVMITHLNFLYAWATFDSGFYLEVSHRILTSLPWYHVFGMITTTYYLTANRQVIYLTGFNPDKYLSTIQEHKVIGLLVAPPIVVLLAKSALVAKYDVSSVKVVFCGAAPLSPQTAEEMTKMFPNLQRFWQAYGMTEATLAVLKDIDELSAESGLLPVPGSKLKVIDIVTGEKLGPNEEGEICVKIPSLMKGYVDNEAATKASFDAEGFLKSGDIGFYDERGYFSIIDRLKEIIKYKGHQVSPAAIESVILQHSAVADCAVVGAPHDIAGELPTAFVVLKPGVYITDQELLEFINAKVSPLSRVRGGLFFVDEIPKNPSGKILRRVLKQKLLP